MLHRKILLLLIRAVHLLGKHPCVAVSKAGTAVHVAAEISLLELILKARRVVVLVERQVREGAGGHGGRPLLHAVQVVVLVGMGLTRGAHKVGGGGGGLVCGEVPAHLLVPTHKAALTAREPVLRGVATVVIFIIAAVYAATDLCQVTGELSYKCLQKLEARMPK